MLPTKNIVIFIVIAVVIVGIGGVISLGQKPATEPSASITKSGENRTFTSAADSDGDGLKDWEEELRNTDPHNPDTDGDGTPDGQEVTEHRDPLTAGPDDELPEPYNETTTSEGGTQTKTELFAREVFGALVQQKQSGNFNTESFAPFSSSLVSYFQENNNSSSKTFTLEDITTVPSNAENTRTYGNTLGGLLIEYGQMNLKNELAIVQEAVTANSPQALSQLDTNISVYNTIIDEHKAVPVPEDAVDVHIKVLNEYQALLGSIQQMKQILNDPLTGSLAIKNYNDHEEGLVNALRDLKFYFLSRPVIFSENEAGYIFEQ